jgi:hypothetical protein
MQSRKETAMTMVESDMHLNTKNSKRNKDNSAEGEAPAKDVGGIIFYKTASLPKAQIPANTAHTPPADPAARKPPSSSE